MQRPNNEGNTAHSAWNGAGLKPRIPLLLFLGIFIWLFVFYTRIHPVYVFSPDDWTYISSGRSAVPSLRDWNPSRIFPETVMPVVAGFAVHVVNVFVQDYMHALTLTYAAFIAAFISFYLYAVYRFLRSLYRLNEFQAGIIGAFFLFFHYFIFASLDADNLHLLYIYDLTNCFNYMLPTMLNIALILFLAWCERDGNRLLSGSPLLRAGIYLLVYLAVFSHLFSGYLLAIYAAIHIAYRLFFQKKKEGLIPYALILLMFGLSMLLESRGMRSENIDQSFALGLTLSVLARRLWHVKKLFVLISVLLIGGASFVWYRDRKKNGKEDDGASTVYIRVMAGCAIFVPLSMIWIVLLCAASNAMYVQRMDVLLAPAVFYILAVTNAIAFLLRRYPRAITITPLALYIGIAMIWSVEGRSFLGEENPEGWIALENHHIEQFVEADQAGQKSVTLELTDIYEEKWMGDRIARTLYKHGITSRQLKVHPVHSAELKDRYQLKTPQMPWRD